MMDLETKLAEARERLAKTFVNSQRAIRTCFEGFDAAADIAREVVAERDAQFEFEAAGFVRRLAEKDKRIRQLMTHKLTYAQATVAEAAAHWEAEARRLHDLCDEKDAEIARLKADIDGLIDGSCPPRKVSDAQRGWIARILIEKWLSIAPNDDLISEICAIFDQDEPAAK